MALSRQHIIDLLVGKTHTLKLATGKQAHIYYQTQSTAFMQLPDTGNPMRGTWQATEGGYHCDWTDGPSIDWVLEMRDNDLAYISNDGAEAGRVTASIPGDSAGLKTHFA